MMAARTDVAAADQEIAALLSSLLKPEVSSDPYPVYARLREFGPVRWQSAGGVLVLTGYEDCAAVMRGQGFGAQSPEWLDRRTPGWRERPAKIATFETMLFRDPPDHTRLRRLVSAAFTPRHAERMRADIAERCATALNQLAEAGSDGGQVDFHEFVAARLPTAVIGSLVGVPESDQPALRESMTALLQLVELGITKQMIADADAAAMALTGYFSDLAAERARRPGTDLASAVVAARQAASGEKFTDDEVVQTLTFVFMAGVDTMANLLANGAFALLTNPPQAHLARQSAPPYDDLVDEVLRYDAPVQLVGRVPAADTVIGGIRVTAGELVLALIGAGNRDPGRFPSPGAFDITRRGTAPLSFGGGIHRCLGAPLARVEAGEFLSGLVRRFPGARLAGEPVRAGVVFRGFSCLPVAVR
jgi:cytochrome P450